MLRTLGLRTPRCPESPAPVAVCLSAGDDRDFDDVYRALAPRIYGRLKRLSSDASLAEDLTQETFERMYRSRAECWRGTDLAPWAFTIARNLFLDHVRRAEVQRAAVGQRDEGEQVSAPYAPTPEDEVAAWRMALSIEEVLGSLPEQQSKAFRLVRGGQSSTDVAARVGRTELAVRLSVHRTRTAIREHLSERWDIVV